MSARKIKFWLLLRRCTVAAVVPLVLRLLLSRFDGTRRKSSWTDVQMSARKIKFWLLLRRWTVAAVIPLVLRLLFVRKLKLSIVVVVVRT